MSKMSHCIEYEKNIKIKLEEINKENKEIIFINMEKILSQNYFLDHCHLLPKGQRILAEEILKNIK